MKSVIEACLKNIISLNITFIKLIFMNLHFVGKCILSSLMSAVCCVYVFVCVLFQNSI